MSARAGVGPDTSVTRPVPEAPIITGVTPFTAWPPGFVTSNWMSKVCPRSTLEGREEKRAVRLPGRPVSEAPTPDRSYNREELTWHEESHACADSFGDWPVRFYSDLYAALRGGASLPITPEAIRRRIAVIEKARAAA